MRVTWRRVATTAAFTGMMTTILVLVPLVRGEDVDGFARWSVPAVGMVFGYLLWPAWTAGARRAAVVPARERLTKTAAAMAAGIAAAVAGGWIVRQRFEANDLLSAVAIFVALFAFVALMPRIAGAERS